MARLLTVVFCLFVGLTAASKKHKVICTFPHRYHAVVFDTSSFSFFHMDVDFANNVAVQTPFNRDLGYQIVLNFKKGLRTIVETSKACVDTEYPVLKNLIMAVRNDATHLGTHELNGRTYTGYEQTLDADLVQTLYAEVKSDSTCYPGFERITHKGETIALPLYFNVELRKEALTIPDVSKCSTAQWEEYWKSRNFML